MVGFGARLRGLRIENNLTQKGLATILKVSIPTLSHWECDYQEPSFKDLTNLGRTFNVTVEYILGLEDDFGVRAPNTAPMGAVYTETERQLIAEFRKLPADSRKLVLRMVGIAEESKAANKKA